MGHCCHFGRYLSITLSYLESGEIYKWKDKDGNIVFSDTPPPPGVDVEKKEFKKYIGKANGKRKYPKT